MNPQINYTDFSKIDIRTGTIVHAELFDEAIKPAYKLKIDFGDLGIRKSSAQLVKNYSAEELIGKQITAVVNFPPKQIANFMSECLVLGAVDSDGNVTLLSPLNSVANGSKIA